ncbi:MAG TPA: threonine aldolase family protein, partial [Acidimicrobiales bacterium]|nr:threonine aldolase family protein [Acidimicrobiales bacterium]
MEIVDLRSDTVTRPTPEMRSAMADAEVGDDAYGEDPTVIELQDEYADRVGKEAALYVPSGTMANQLALRVHGTVGGSVIAGRRQHVVAHEAGAAGANTQTQFHIVDDEGGTISPDDVTWARKAAEYHWPTPSLVCIENTHMPASGAPWSLDELAELRASADELPIHMDGARLFNAEVATGI